MPVPSVLPPSVEEAYRRKCIQLKNRTNEVEEANDAARLRLSRIKRQVEKLRIERAFLLEQLAKRTSTNVEDSDGSPSPPPTDINSMKFSELDANPRKPKDKPLRTKRGHRKTAEGGDSKSATAAVAGDAEDKANGVSGSSKKPGDAFELYCDETREVLKSKTKSPDVNLDEELAKAWEGLPDAEKEEYQAKFDRLKTKDSGSKEESPADKKDAKDSKDSKDAMDEKNNKEEKVDKEDAADKPDKAEKVDKHDKADKQDEEANKDKPEKGDEKKPQPEDEDVEMGNYDDEADQEARLEAKEE